MLDCLLMESCRLRRSVACCWDVASRKFLAEEMAELSEVIGLLSLFVS